MLKNECVLCSLALCKKQDAQTAGELTPDYSPVLAVMVYPYLGNYNVYGVVRSQSVSNNGE